MPISLTSDQIVSLTTYVREQYHEIKKNKKEKEEAPRELLTCAQQLDTIRNTPFMLQDVLEVVDWDIAGESLEELPLKIHHNINIVTLTIIKWRLENGI